MISVALYKPETDGNVGAVARVMKNFGFSDLMIVDPKCNYLSDESLRRSRHADDILRKAKISKNLDFLKKFNLVIGTTAIVGTDYNIQRSPIEISRFLEEFENISGHNANDFFTDKKNRILLLFGPEGTGLTNDELKKCDYLITVPTSPKYKALNLSHAVGIVLYEFSRNIADSGLANGTCSHSESDKDIVEIAGRPEKERLKRYSDSAVSKLYEGDPKVFVVKDSLDKMISKSILTKREVFAMMGFFKNVEKYTVHKPKKKSAHLKR